QFPDPSIHLILASGHVDEVLTAIGRRPVGPPLLLTFSSGRWQPPLSLDGVSHLTSLVRLDAEHWLFGGRLESGSGFVATFDSARARAEVMPAPPTRAYVAGASAPARGLALMVGSHGVTWRVDQEGNSSVFVEGEPDLTASSVDILDREWVASAGA